MRRRFWVARCCCGKVRSVRQDQLVNGTSRSCGCLIKRCRTHGMSDTITYASWVNMRSRCKTDKRYVRRNLCVCRRWNVFENFLADMGPRPSLAYSIDRKNNKYGYTPRNCRWATALQQSNNTRRNIYLTFSGKTMTIADWAREMRTHAVTLYGRKAKGWSPKEVLYGRKHK